MTSDHDIDQFHPDPSAASPLPVQSFRIGSLECKVLSDGYVAVPVALLAAVPIDELKSFLAPHGQDGDIYRNPISCLAVTLADGTLVIVDSGIGKVAGHQGAPVPTAGRFAESVRQAGIDPASVRVVLVSHLHPDHFGGLFDDTDAPLFPNASYHVCREEAVFWEDPATELTGTLMPPPMRAHTIAAARRFLTLAGDRLKLFDAGGSPVAGVSTLPLPGHTPGQVGFLFDGGDELLLYTADCAGHPLVSLQKPDWRFAFDENAPVAVESRKRLTRQLIETGWYSFTPHFPWPAFGHVDEQHGLPVWTAGKRQLD